MAVKLVAEQEIRVGETAFVQGASPTPPFVVIFEDDGTTGYFYAYDTSRTGNPIVDAMHIYNVADVTDKHLPSFVQIVWSEDDQKAALLINKYPHAIFDFSARRGYCRTGFPPPTTDGWTQHGHEWNDKAEDLFR
jgi:hypothetical protein